MLRRVRRIIRIFQPTYQGHTGDLGAARGMSVASAVASAERSVDWRLLMMKQSMSSPGGEGGDSRCRALHCIASNPM